MKKIRWGVLSTANIAKEQVIPAILRSKHAELIGIASERGKAKEVAAAFSIPKYYDTYEQLLQDDEIEAVYIPLPNHLHKKWAMEAAKYGKHVLCEKPAALTASDTREMAEYCASNDVKFMEAFMYQFHPQHKRVQEILATGEIGEIKYMTAGFSFFLGNKETNIRMNKDMGGGSIYDVGCYCIHTIRQLLQSEPREVVAFADLDPEYGVDLSTIVYMKMENGVKAVFDSSFEMASRQEYEIIGTKGRIIVPRAFRSDTFGGEGLVIVRTNQSEREEKISGDQYKEEVEFFSKAILEDSDLSYLVENTLRNMIAIDACNESIQTSQTVKL